MLKKIVLCSLLIMSSGVGLFAQQASKVVEQPKRNFWAQFGRDVLLYIPNRLLDINDLITIKAGAGGTFATEVKITEFARLGGFHGPFYFLESGYHRQFGAGYQDGSEFALGCWAYDNYVIEDSVGSIEEFALVQDFGMINSKLYPYQKEQVDLWSIGAAAGAFFSIRCEIHLREAPDMVAGFFFFDPSEDDYK